MTAGVGELVQDDDGSLFRTAKGFVWRHLDDIKRSVVKGAFTTNPNRHAARLNDEVHVLDALGERLRRSRGRKGRNAVNLRSVKDRECSQHRDSPRLGATVPRFVLDFDRLIE